MANSVDPDQTAPLSKRCRGARWLSGRVSDSRARGWGFDTYRRRVVFLSKTLYSPKVLVNYPGSGGSVPTWLEKLLTGTLSLNTNKQTNDANGMLLHPNDANQVANSVDSDQTVPSWNGKQCRPWSDCSIQMMQMEWQCTPWSDCSFIQMMQMEWQIL